MPALRSNRWTPLATAGAILALTLLVLSSSAAAVAPQKAQVVWTKLTPTTSPEARKYVQMAYDPAARAVVEYGGYNPFCYFLGAGCQEFYFDTWEFAAGNWTPVNTSTHPTAPTGLVLAYDPALDGVLAFGGQLAASSYSSAATWLFANGSWTQLHPTSSPPPRYAYGMAYDAYDHEMVLFGGEGSNGSYLRDTWAFNGTTWIRLHPKLNPLPRTSPLMVFDPLDNETLMVGGWDNGQWLKGTWAFQSGQWTLLASAPGHFANSTPTRNLAYLSVLPDGTPVLFGGEIPGNPYHKFASTFEFTGSGWARVSQKNPPPALGNGGLAYDAADGYDVLFGGGFDNLTCSNGTWTLT